MLGLSVKRERARVRPGQVKPKDASNCLFDRLWHILSAKLMPIRPVYE